MANDWDKVIDDLNEIRHNDVLIRRALTSVLAYQKQRIFNHGLDANNSRIGQYSTKKISISRKNQARNTGQTTFPGGYAQYKSMVGKNPGYVTLRNTDQMMIDYGLEILGPDTYGLGFTNDFNYDKSQWMEDKYHKDIFDQSDQEGDIIENILSEQI